MPTNKNNNSAENVVKNSTTTIPEKNHYIGITSFVYIGPSLPGGKLKSNAVLSGTYEEITEYFREVIKDYPQVTRLIVPVSQLAELRTKAETRGNIINKYYNDIAGAIKNKDGEEN